METEAIQDLLNTLDEDVLKLENGEPLFTDRRYKVFPISTNNFIQFEPTADIQSRIAFVDGGNSLIISTPTFSISLIRIYFNIFGGEGRLITLNQPIRIEFYAISRTMMKGGELYYTTELFPFDKKFDKLLPLKQHITFNPHDETIRIGAQMMGIENMGNIIRRFAEWNMIPYIADILEEGDLIVRDGSLQTSITGEAIYSKKAYHACKKDNVILSGLSKTSSLYTNTGNSLTAVIKKEGAKKFPKKTWYYNPIAKISHPDHLVEMFFIKLHPSSDYCFRFEIYKEQAEKMSKEELSKLFGTLSKNSCDMTFVGYPYGLIDADLNARVRGDEIQYHAALFLSKVPKKDAERIMDLIRANDAHDTLNRILR